jgi:hypothetical protein
MNSIKRRLEKLEETANSGEIRSFEEMMSECVRVTDALESGVRLDSLKFKQFHPAMRAGIAKAIGDIERAMSECLENEGTLPLELTAQLIVIYRDPDARALLTPTLKELVETIFQLERDGALSVAAE